MLALQPRKHYSDSQPHPCTQPLTVRVDTRAPTVSSVYATQFAAVALADCSTDCVSALTADPTAASVYCCMLDGSSSSDICSPTPACTTMSFLGGTMHHTYTTVNPRTNQSTQSHHIAYAWQQVCIPQHTSPSPRILPHSRRSRSLVCTYGFAVGGAAGQITKSSETTTTIQKHVCITSPSYSS
jgi:hypothetical protein